MDMFNINIDIININCRYHINQRYRSDNETMKYIYKL